MTEHQTTERSTTGHQMTECLNSQRQNYSTSNASQNLKRHHVEKLNNETSQPRKTECRTERENFLLCIVISYDHLVRGRGERPPPAPAHYLN
jgi:hypothetical protein